MTQPLLGKTKRKISLVLSYCKMIYKEKKTYYLMLFLLLQKPLL